jgi:hypothetical protein
VVDSTANDFDAVRFRQLWFADMVSGTIAKNFGIATGPSDQPLARASHRQSPAKKASRHYARYGVLWADRFERSRYLAPADKSVLLEGGEALAAEYRKYLFGRGIFESSIIMSS